MILEEIKTKNQYPCSECVYRAPEGDANQCDYILKTGKVRGCPPGKACTKFEQGKKKRGGWEALDLSDHVSAADKEAMRYASDKKARSGSKVNKGKFLTT